MGKGRKEIVHPRGRLNAIFLNALWEVTNDFYSKFDYSKANKLLTAFREKFNYIFSE